VVLFVHRYHQFCNILLKYDPPFHPEIIICTLTSTQKKHDVKPVRAKKYKPLSLKEVAESVATGLMLPSNGFNSFVTVMCRLHNLLPITSPVSPVVPGIMSQIH